MDKGIESARAALLGRLGLDAAPKYFEEALTHSSYANEHRAQRVPDNQRLEFLGDAVLGLCVSELLSETHPKADEGMLTRMRSGLVNAEALAQWAKAERIGVCLALGRGAQAGSEREQTNVLADAVEALVAAVFESHGLDGARALVRAVVREPIPEAERLAMSDTKSALQEKVQAEGSAAPWYRVVSTRGPQHDQVFEVEVLVGEAVRGRGEGRSKRLAERAAALAALETIDAAVATPPPPDATSR
jgi:ribonuclease-3